MKISNVVTESWLSHRQSVELWALYSTASVWILQDADAKAGLDMTKIYWGKMPVMDEVMRSGVRRGVKDKSDTGKKRGARSEWKEPQVAVQASAVACWMSPASGSSGPALASCSAQPLGSQLGTTCWKAWPWGVSTVRGAGRGRGLEKFGGCQPSLKQVSLQQNEWRGTVPTSDSKSH